MRKQNKKHDLIAELSKIYEIGKHKKATRVNEKMKKTKKSKTLMEYVTETPIKF